MTSIPSKDAARLLDMFQSVQTIQTYVAGQTREQFQRDLKTQDVVLRRFLVVGEAATPLTPETRSALPFIPFAQIIGMRNRVVHDYGNVDVDIVWETIQQHLPALVEQLEQFFEERSQSS